jgi:hypothetical protein
MTDVFGPDDPGPPDDWWDEPFTVYGADYPDFPDYTFTVGEWIEMTLTYDQEELLERFGVDQIDILHQLEERSDWGSERAYYYDEDGELHSYSIDWADWREQYEGV